MNSLLDLEDVLNIEALQDKSLSRVLGPLLRNNVELSKICDRIRKESLQNAAFAANYYDPSNMEEDKLKLVKFADIINMFGGNLSLEVRGLFDIWLYSNSKTGQEKRKLSQRSLPFPKDATQEFMTEVNDRLRLEFGKDYTISNVDIFIAIVNIPQDCPHPGYLLERESKIKFYLFYFRSFGELVYKVDLIGDREVVALDIEKLVFLQTLNPIWLDSFFK